MSLIFAAGAVVVGAARSTTVVTVTGAAGAVPPSPVTELAASVTVSVPAGGEAADRFRPYGPARPKARGAR